MTALALLGGLSGGAGGQTFGGDAGPATSGGVDVSSAFGGFGGLNFTGGTSGRDNQGGVSPLVIGAVATVAVVALLVALKK